MRRLILLLLPGFVWAYTPTADYQEREIHGWRVLTNPDLVADDLYEPVMKELEVQLFRVARRLPPAAVRELREVPLWMELDDPKPLCMAYHPFGNDWLGLNQMNPDKQGAVDTGSARRFLDWTQQQPWMVLHELAHAFHDRLPKRFENPVVLAAFEHARDAGLYEQVLRWSGRDERAYALNNQMEYFAEITEAYFARNDYFPFVRAELARYDPRGLKVMKTLWGVADSDTYLWQVPTLPHSSPWDLTALSRVPEIEWLDRDSPVHSLLYPGEPFRGEPTQVFAYYASPGTLAGKPELDVGLPGVVLVHGGGGTAFEEWAELWAKRGYAAIAMDLAGKAADRVALPNGGPDQSHTEKFDWIDRGPSEQWQYHAVAAVIRGHTVLRAMPEVDDARTALTGISWGGYLTCIVAGLDKRFAAAVPVYGCGFLPDGSAWDSEFSKMNQEQRDHWVELWEPSRYLESAEMPVFFVNGTNDFAYWLPSYHKTYELVSERTLRIEISMKHGHQPGWAPKEIGLFIDSVVNRGKPLLALGTPEEKDGSLSLEVADGLGIQSAALHFTTGDGPPKDRKWETAPASIDGRRIHASTPKDGSIYYLSVTDERGAMVSSDLIFREP
jgi:dienelactone hydrolase